MKKRIYIICALLISIVSSAQISKEALNPYTTIGIDYYDVGDTGKLVVSVFPISEVIVYNLFTSKEIARLNTTNKYGLRGVYLFQNDEKILLEYEETLQVWNAITYTLEKTVTIEKHDLGAFHKNSETFVYIGKENTVRLNVTTADKVIIKGPKTKVQGYINDLYITQDASIAISLIDGVVEILDLQGAKKPIKISTGPINAVSIGAKSICVLGKTSNPDAKGSSARVQFFNLSGEAVSERLQPEHAYKTYAPDIIPVWNELFFIGGYSGVVEVMGEKGSYGKITYSEDYSSFTYFENIGVVFKSSDHISFVSLEGELLGKFVAKSILHSARTGGTAIRKNRNTQIIEDTIYFYDAPFRESQVVSSQKLMSPYVNSLDYSDDILAFGSRDGAISIWDRASESQIATTDKNYSFVQDLVISQQDQIVAAIYAESNEVRIFDIISGREIERLLIDATPTCVDINDGWIAVGTNKGTYNTWKIKGQTYESTVMAKEGIYPAISSIHIKNNGVYLGGYGRMFQASLTKEKITKNKLFVGHNNDIKAIATSPDGKYILSSDLSGGIHLWEEETQHQIKNINTSATWFDKLKLKSDFLIEGNGPGNDGAEVGNKAFFNSIADPLPELLVQSSNSSSTSQISFSPDGKYIASIDGDRIKVRDVLTGFLVSEIKTHNDIVNSFDFTADSKTIIVASGSSLEYFDTLSSLSKKIIDLSFKNRSIHQILRIPNFNMILAINNHGWHYPLILHVNSGKFLGTLDLNPNNGTIQIIKQVKFSQDGKKIVVLDKNSVNVFSIDSSFNTKLITSIKLDEEAKTLKIREYIDFSPDGNKIIYYDGSNNGSYLKVYDLLLQKEISKQTGFKAKFIDNENIIKISESSVERLEIQKTTNIEHPIPLTSQYDHEEIILSFDYNKKNNLLASGDLWGNIKIWDVAKRRAIFELDRFQNDTYHSSIGNSGKAIAYNNRNGIYLFDLQSLQTTRLEGDNYPYFGAFSPKNNDFYFRKGKDIYIRNGKTQKSTKLFSTNVDYKEAGATEISDDGTLLYFSTRFSDDVHIYNIESRKKVGEFDKTSFDGYNSISSIKLEQEDKIYLYGTGIKKKNDSILAISFLKINLENRAISELSKPHFLNIKGKFASFRIRDNSKINTVSSNKRYYVFQENYHIIIEDLQSKKNIYDAYNSQGAILTAQFNEDDSRLIIAFESGLIEVISLKTLEVSHSFYGNSLGIADIQIKGKLLKVQGVDEKITIFKSAKDYEELYSLYFIEDGNFIIKNKEGYYFASKDISSAIAFKKGYEIYPFEQYDPIYNRPDLASQPLVDQGVMDKNLQKAYYNAFLKRMKRLNIDPKTPNKQLDLPQLQVTNTLPVSIVDTQLSITLDAESKTTNLDKLHVWVNDVPIYGSQGLSLSGEKKKLNAKNIAIVLTPGTNKIQLAVADQSGLESLKQTFVITSTANKTLSDLYIVSIGVSKYRNSSYNLKYAAKDAQDILEYSQSISSKYKEIKTLSLLDAQVNREGLDTVNTFLAASNPDDTVIIFYAGHGVIDDNFDYYLASHDMDFDNPGLKGIPYETLEGLLDGIGARQKLLLIDACHSGEVDKEDMEKMELENTSVSATARGGIALKNKKVGLQNSFQLMQLLFADLRRGTGATVISSASGVELAYEGPKWNNGVFTYALLDGLKSGKTDLDGDSEVTVSELKSYVSDKVYELTNGLQNPTSRRLNIKHNFTVW